MYFTREHAHASCFECPKVIRTYVYFAVATGLHSTTDPPRSLNLPDNFIGSTKPLRADDFSGMTGVCWGLMTALEITLIMQHCQDQWGPRGFGA